MVYLSSLTQKTIHQPITSFGHSCLLELMDMVISKAKAKPKTETILFSVFKVDRPLLVHLSLLLPKMLQRLPISFGSKYPSLSHRRGLHRIGTRSRNRDLAQRGYCLNMSKPEVSLYFLVTPCCFIQ